MTYNLSFFEMLVKSQVLLLRKRRMKKSNVAKMFFVFSAVSVFLFTGCKGISLDSGGGSDCSVEYGSLSIAKDVNRSMDVSEINKVKVTVSGTGITVPLTAEKQT